MFSRRLKMEQSDWFTVALETFPSQVLLRIPGFDQEVDTHASSSTAHT